MHGCRARARSRAVTGEQGAQGRADPLDHPGHDLAPRQLARTAAVRDTARAAAGACRPGQRGAEDARDTEASLGLPRRLLERTRGDARAPARASSGSRDGARSQARGRQDGGGLDGAQPRRRELGASGLPRRPPPRIGPRSSPRDCPRSGAGGAPGRRVHRRLLDEYAAGGELGRGAGDGGGATSTGRDNG